MAALVLLATTGCTHLREVDTTVNSYARPPAIAPGTTFTLEPLPSQEKGHDRDFASLARSVCQALVQRGLRPYAAAGAAATPALLITLHPQSSQTSPPWGYDPWMDAWGYRRHGGLTARALLRDAPPTVYRRSLQLVVREASSQQVVYETQATYEDIWRDDAAIYGVLAQAALSTFPHPPPGEQRVRLPLLHTPPSPPSTTPDGC